MLLVHKHVGARGVQPPTFLILYDVMQLIAYPGTSMRRARSLLSAQARAQHVPHVRFVAHANLSPSLLASDEIDRLYSQV